MVKLKIALRYLFSRKSHSIINLLSVVSVVAIVVPVAAAIFIVSLHNGLSDVIKSSYSKFDPDLKIETVNGQLFCVDSIQIPHNEAIEQITYVVEGDAVIEYKGRQLAVKIKGVDQNYLKVTRVDSLLSNGEFELRKGDLNQLVVGQGVAYALGINVALLEPIKIFSLVSMPFVAMPLVNEQSAFPSGTFVLDKQTDGQLVFASSEFAQKIFATNFISAVEIKLKNSQNQNVIAQEIEAELGDKFVVKTKLEQRESLFKVINIEKWITVMLLMLIVVIAALSLVGAMVIMVTEKHKQNQTLLVLGYTVKDIKKIYLWLGWAISIIGVGLGAALGIGISFAQQTWEFLTIGSESFLIDAYPVDVVYYDVSIISAVVMTVTVTIVWITTRFVKIDKI